MIDTSRKTYKAIMCDVDGTLIPYDYHSMPSKKVIEAVKKAREKVTMCLVTGRAFNVITEILKKFDLTHGFAITNGGAVVLDVATREIIYDKPLEAGEAEELVSLLKEMNISFYMKTNPFEGADTDGVFKNQETFETVYMVHALEDYPEEQINELFKKLSHLSHLTLHKSKHKSPTKFGFNVTHAEATKAHGIEVLMKRLNLKREDIIGIGDGWNDYPLLMASGLKVAMGNAIPELKDIADYIAPSVSEDGVADVINKFVL